MAMRAAKSLPSLSMAGKVCLVTGGARGLGYEFCRAFVQSGCSKIAILDIKDAKCAAKQLVDEFASSDTDLGDDALSVLGIECDVAAEQSVQEAFKEVIETFGRVDSVVANAGIVENIPALEYPFDRVQRVYDVNVHGAFFTAREAAKNMIPRGAGSIILIASMSATIVNLPQPQMPYNASKAGTYAICLVRINVLSPGYMVTNLTKKLFEDDEDLKKQWEDRTPMGRMGEPEDLAGAIVFLASDASRFMTGSELRVDGGYCLI